MVWMKSPQVFGMGGNEYIVANLSDAVQVILDIDEIKNITHKKALAYAENRIAESANNYEKINMMGWKIHLYKAGPQIECRHGMDQCTYDDDK